MLCLKSKTEDAWLARAIADTPALLIDHAHCERKAASQALALLSAYPGHPELIAPVVTIAHEELEHFTLICGILAARGLVIEAQGPTGYQAGLFKKVRKEEPGRLIDKLLVAALIEARSCERFKLLSQHHPDPELRQIFGDLLASEARHHADFVRLAELQADRGEIHDRLRHLAEVEVRAIERAKPLPRIHS
ncbi:MAG: tRNA-(ms[2]io[6]A)-hydroxylase [Myxococcales bacterium]|nr:tRNA-(ms[2]io[6]A)-hydroxylase [Myxococcales bacterium]